MSVCGSPGWLFSPRCPFSAATPHRPPPLQSRHSPPPPPRLPSPLHHRWCQFSNAPRALSPLAPGRGGSAPPARMEMGAPCQWQFALHGVTPPGFPWAVRLLQVQAPTKASRHEFEFITRPPKQEPAPRVSGWFFYCFCLLSCHPPSLVCPACMRARGGAGHGDGRSRRWWWRWGGWVVATGLGYQLRRQPDVDDHQRPRHACRQGAVQGPDPGQGNPAVRWVPLCVDAPLCPLGCIRPAQGLLVSGLCCGRRVVVVALPRAS